MGSNLSGGKHKFKRWEYKRVGVLGFGSWGLDLDVQGTGLQNIVDNRRQLED